MPQTIVRVFRGANRKTPLLDWLGRLKTRDPRGYGKCLQRILALSQLGSELRRPLADILRDGIHELRMRVGTVQHRILYFFVGRNLAVLSNGLTKEGEVDDSEIDAAVRNKALATSDLDRYTVEWDDGDEDG